MRHDPGLTIYTLFQSVVLDEGDRYLPRRSSLWHEKAVSIESSVQLLSTGKLQVLTILSSLSLNHNSRTSALGLFGSS